MRLPEVKCTLQRKDSSMNVVIRQPKLEQNMIVLEKKSLCSWLKNFLEGHFNN